MLMMRSAAFNLLFYLSTLVLMIVGLPTLIVGRSAILRLARLWSHVQLWLLDKICGLGVEFRGVENIPSGGCIVAAKHQSVWETFALLIFFDNFSYILKRELMFIPIFGWYLGRSKQIAINRSDRRNALTQASDGARKLLGQGGQVLIFPEGTRRPVDAPPVYRFGVARIYSECGVPCLPVALNSGLFWPRRSFRRHSGKVLVEFLPPIAPGMSKDAFFNELQQRLETATARLVAEAKSPNSGLAQAAPPSAAAASD